MTAVLRLGLFLSICAGLDGALASTAIAQDSARLRALECGTHRSTLNRRDGTATFREALSKVALCPEGPELLSQLWREVTVADSGFVRHLAAVSSLTERRIADAMIQAVSSRTRPTALRIAALEQILRQVNGKFGSIVFMALLSPTLDREGRIVRVDTTFEAHLVESIPPSRPRPVDAATRAEILAVLNQVAADSADASQMRAAAREIAKLLSSQRQP